jgi:uncharacterized protein (TIGR03437 family)
MGRSLIRTCVHVAVALLTMGAARADIGSSTSPTYTAAGIVNAATQTADALAPNTIATLYGTNLATDTAAVSPSDVHGGTLPNSLLGVSVVVRGLPSSIFYVSPGQINFLIPYELTAGPVSILVVRQGTAGLPVTVQLVATAPGFFEWDGNLSVAGHLNGSVISPTAPAHSGEVIVLYAAGLGRTNPDTSSGKIASFAAPISAASQLQVLLNGQAAPPGSVLYAGLAPGFAGLYQINLLLPANLPPNPEIRISIGPQISPALVQLPLQ